MSLKRIPTPSQDAGNWGTILNDHIAQTQNPLNGAFNSFDQFSARPTNLTAGDAGRTYLYTQTGNWHEWSGSEWKVHKTNGVANVKDYGAIGDYNLTTKTGTDDHPAMQKCINENYHTYIPDGNYLLNDTLEIASNKEISGQSKKNTVLCRKPANKTNLGTRLSNTGATDDFNVNAYFAYTYVQSEVYNRDTKITNLTLTSSVRNLFVDYGFYAPRSSVFLISDIEMYFVIHGLYGHDIFLGTFQRIGVHAHKTVVSLVEDTVGVCGGTTLNLCDISCNGGEYLADTIGYDIHGLNYSSFTHCSSDGHTKAFNFVNCSEIVLNGCGAEGVYPKSQYSSVFSAYNSKITINAMRILGVSNFAFPDFPPYPIGEDAYYLLFVNSKIVMNTCSFSPIASVPNKMFNLALLGSSSVIANNCTLPDNDVRGTAINDTSVLQD